jgi:hypothetical protein
MRTNKVMWRNAPAIAAISFIGERGAATTAMTGAGPTQNIALSCARKL